jgi:hypothetical protein
MNLNTPLSYQLVECCLLIQPANMSKKGEAGQVEGCHLLEKLSDEICSVGRQFRRKQVVCATDPLQGPSHSIALQQNG